jgi:antitoxin YefM
MTRILPISEVKARLPELVTGVEDREEEIVVTRKGKPAAVLVSHAEYESWGYAWSIVSWRRCVPSTASSLRPWEPRAAGLK